MENSKFILPDDDNSRIIEIGLKNSVLKGYTEKNMSFQNEEWKDYTKNVHKLQTLLYEVGFPCFEPKQLVNFNNIILFEELSKEKHLVLDQPTYNDLKKVFRHLYFDFNYIKQYFELENYEEHLCLLHINLFRDIYLNKNNNFIVNDISGIRTFNKEDWFFYLKMLWPNNMILDYYRMVEDIKTIEEKNSWKLLSHAESVKRKLAHLFQKDTTVSQEDLLKSVFTMLSGAKHAK